eukprot:768706-Hanusia_phi.AAC.5
MLRVHPEVFENVIVNTHNLPRRATDHGLILLASVDLHLNLEAGYGRPPRVLPSRFSSCARYVEKLTSSSDEESYTPRKYLLRRATSTTSLSRQQLLLTHYSRFRARDSELESLSAELWLGGLDRSFYLRSSEPLTNSDAPDDRLHGDASLAPCSLKLCQGKEAARKKDKYYTTLRPAARYLLTSYRSLSEFFLSRHIWD